VRKVELVHSSVYRVVIDRGQHVEASLFKAKAEPARTGEEI
jgi:hypothetical protein